MKTCPICNSSAKLLYELPMGNFDGSKLYKTIELMSCTYCGHVFNSVDNVNALKQYYNEEYRDFIKDDDGRKNLEKIYIYFVDSSDFFIQDSYGHDLVEFNYRQELEHSINPLDTMHEIANRMATKGILNLSVPDASRYLEYEPFNFYWLSLREHVQHFDLNHILMLAGMCKFELVSYEQNDIEIVGKYKMPNLDIVLRYNPETKIKYRKNLFELEFKMMNYCMKQEAARKQKDLNLLMPRKIFVWGISREFMYAYENLGLKNYDIILVDDTPIKQQKYTIDRKQIFSSDILKDTQKESCLIITAIAHREELKEKALQLGFKGEIIDL